MAIKIGIVGCGWIVENGHIPALIKNEKYTVLSLFDINYDKVTSLGEKFDIEKNYYSFDEFCNSGIEAAIVATPNYTHFEYTKKLIKCGIHVLCEKPVVINVQEINQLKSVLQENKVIYLPGFVNRWREDIQTILKIVESKKIGDIIKIEAGWIRKNGVPKPGTWFTNKELSGGGVLIDLGTHILDICLMIIGDEHTDEIKVNTTMLSNDCDWGNGQAHWFGEEYGLKYKINVESGAKAAIKFANGIKLNLHLKWQGDSTADYTYFNIIGENGTIELKTLFGFSNERQYKDSLVINSKNKGTIDIKLNHNSTSYAFDKMYEYFYKAIIEQRQSYINIQDAYKVVCLIEDLYKSNEK